MLRVTCAYWTLYDSAIMAVAVVITIDHLAVERQNIFRLASELEGTEAAVVARSETLRSWQHR